MATVKVNIERKPDPKKAVPKDDDDSGFLAGLAAGWNGLKSTVVAVATVVGAVLPFAGVALLIGVPVWLLVRRMRRTPASPRLPRRAVSECRLQRGAVLSVGRERETNTHAPPITSSSGIACTNRVSSSS